MMRSPIKRFTALLAAVCVLIGSAPRAQAVTPQEGWYISDQIEWSGDQYYVIDNKLNNSEWYFETSSQRAAYDYDANSALTSRYDEILWMGQYWRGYSDTTWRIDQDWVIRINVQQVWRDGSEAKTVIKPIIYDCTMTPSYSISWETLEGTKPVTDADINTWAESVTLTEDCINAIPYNNDAYTVANIQATDWNTDLYFKVSDWNIPNLLGFNSSLSGTDINNLILTFAIYSNSASLQYSTLRVKASVEFMVPVNKCPAGMAVGDYWPKVRPLEVEIEDAFNAYKENMLANGQISDPGDIDSMFGQLGNLKDQGLGSLDIDDSASTEVVSGVLTMFYGLTHLLLPVVGLGLVLLIFVNKGMHG